MTQKRKIWKEIGVDIFEKQLPILQLTVYMLDTFV